MAKVQAGKRTTEKGGKMTTLMSAGLEVMGDFLFFQVNARKDNGDHISMGFRVLNFRNYDDKDMALQIFTENLRGLVSGLEKEIEDEPLHGTANTSIKEVGLDPSYREV